jgi:hypothetical protein
VPGASSTPRVEVKIPGPGLGADIVMRAAIVEVRLENCSTLDIVKGPHRPYCGSHPWLQ